MHADLKFIGILGTIITLSGIVRKNDKNALKINKNCAKIVFVHFPYLFFKKSEGGGLGAWPPVASLTTLPCEPSHSRRVGYIVQMIL